MLVTAWLGLFLLLISLWGYLNLDSLSVNHVLTDFNYARLNFSKFFNEESLNISQMLLFSFQLPEELKHLLVNIILFLSN